jgi:hypothetical protein
MLTGSRGRERRRRQLTATLCGLSLAFHGGCYTYLPVQSAPPPAQERVAVVLTDSGRLQLGERLGPLVERVEGVLVSHDSTGVALEVTGTRDLRGGSALWSRERVDIPASAILGYRPRQLSRTRSILLGAGVATTLAVLTFGLTLDLFGSERERGDTASPPGEGTPISQRVPSLLTIP